MELPFAVEPATHSLPHRVVYQDDDDNDDDDQDGSSLVTASSRGSLLGTSQASSYNPIRSGAAPHPQVVGYSYANTHKPSYVTVTTTSSRAAAGAAVPPLAAAAAAASTNSNAANRSNPYDHAFSSMDGLDSVLSQFGVSSAQVDPAPQLSSDSTPLPSHQPLHSAGHHTSSPNPDILNDFQYVTVCETDEDEIDIVPAVEGMLDVSEGEEGYGSAGRARDTILTLLLCQSSAHGPLSQPSHHKSEEVAAALEQANGQAELALLAKHRGELHQAIDAHADAARRYRDAASLVRGDNLSVASSLLVLSQTQAKAALALKRIVRVRPSALVPLPSSSECKPSSQQEMLLRAKVRALSGKAEEDISESTFFGRATASSSAAAPATSIVSASPPPASSADPLRNPVDEMMELERELRNMDMAIEMGSSIASLEARTQHRMKSSMVDGSFMVVPPGSNSYMMSSASPAHGSSLLPAHHHSQAQAAARPRPEAHLGAAGTASVRARANRVQSILESSGRPVYPSTQLVPAPAHPPSSVSAGTAAKPNANTSLESSWWGNSSQASQVLTSSVISLASGIGADHHAVVGGGDGPSSTSTKQLLMHMDSFKTLRDENEALLKEVVGAKAARMEAKAAKDQMRRFRDEYGKRFAALKEALEKYRSEYPPDTSANDRNPVAASEFAKSASAASEQLARQEQIIKKLTAELKKEKEESKKKDAALLKYEGFYREVKARSAAKQRQKESQQQQQQRQQQQHQQLHAQRPSPLHSRTATSKPNPR